MSGPAARPHPSWRIAAVVVSVASLAWVLWLLAAAWPDLSAHRRELRVGPLLEGFTLATLGSVCAFAAFVCEIERCAWRPSDVPAAIARRSAGEICRASVIGVEPACGAES